MRNAWLTPGISTSSNSSSWVMGCSCVSYTTATSLLASRLPFSNSSAITSALSDISGSRIRDGIVIPFCWCCCNLLVTLTNTPFVVQRISCWCLGCSVAAVCSCYIFIRTVFALLNLVEYLRICGVCYCPVLTEVACRASYKTVYAIVCNCLRFSASSALPCTIKSGIPWSNSWVDRVSGGNNFIFQRDLSAITPLNN